MSPIIIDLKVPANHPALPGHFPGQPVVPGVVLLALVHDHARRQLGFPGGASQWRRIKFLRPVGPEQAFRLHLDGGAEKFSFRLESGQGDIIARGQCRHAAMA